MYIQTLPGTTVGTAAESRKLIGVLRDPTSSPFAQSRAKNRLCQVNDKFVVGRVQKKLRGQYRSNLAKLGHGHAEDVLSMARLAFFKSVGTFDPSLGYSLLTYVAQSIDRAVSTYFDEAGFMTLKSASVRLGRCVTRAQRFQAEHGRAPTDAELCTITEYPAATIATLRQYAAMTTCIIELDRPRSAIDTDSTLLDIIPGTPDRESVEAMWDLVEVFANPGDELIMQMRYVDDLAFSTIGERLSMTRQRAKQRHHALLDRIKKYLAV